MRPIAAQLVAPAVRLFVIANLLGAGATLGAGEENEPTPVAEEAAARPSYYLLPIEVDSDSGAANGDAVISRLTPAYSVPLGEKWRLLNIFTAVIADAPGGRPGDPGNPSSVPSGKAFGLGDVSDTLLFSPRGAFWGVGAMVAFPTATEKALGSGKWSAGPAFRLSHDVGPWELGLVVGNLRSFAGDGGRGDIHQLLARGLVRRTLREKWFFIYAPIITANWNASSDQRWLVPLGGGFGRQIILGRPVNISLQAYSNVVRPDGAPRSVVRFALTIPFRLPEGP